MWCMRQVLNDWGLYACMDLHTYVRTYILLYWMVMIDLHSVHAEALV